MAVRGPRPLHGAGGAGPCWPGAGCPGALVAGACLPSDPVVQQRTLQGRVRSDVCCRSGERC